MVVVLLVGVLTVGLVYRVVRSEWMNLKSDRIVCREVSEDLVNRRRASVNDALQMAGDVYLIRSLPSEKYRRATCRSWYGSAPDTWNQSWQAYLELDFVVRAVY